MTELSPMAAEWIGLAAGFGEIFSRHCIVVVLVAGLLGRVFQDVHLKRQKGPPGSHMSHHNVIF